MSQRNTHQELNSNDTIMIERHYIPRGLYEEWYHPNSPRTSNTTPNPNIFNNNGYNINNNNNRQRNRLYMPFVSPLPRTTQHQPQPQFTTTTSTGQNNTSTLEANTTTPNSTTPNSTQPVNNFSYFSRNFGQPQSSGSGVLPSGLRYSFENYDLPNVPSNTNTTSNLNNQQRSRSLLSLFAVPELLNMVNNTNTNTNTNTNSNINSNNYVPSQMEESFLNYFDELLGRSRETQPIGLTEDEVNTVCVESRFNVNDDNQTLSCPICVASYEDTEEICTLVSCNHNFHKTCLTRWLQNHDTCPLCRANVREYQTTNTNTNTNTNTDNYTNIQTQENELDSLD